MRRFVIAGLSSIGVLSTIVVLLIASCRSGALRNPDVAPALPAPGGGEGDAGSTVGARPALIAAAHEKTPAPLAPGERARAGRAHVERVESGIARADVLFEEERWADAGQAYLDVLAAMPEHPDAARLLDRAFEAFEWVESEKQVAVLEEIFRRFPEKRTPSRAFDHAVLEAVHGDTPAALPAAEAVLAELPADAFRVYALRRVAGLCRAVGDTQAEAAFLEEGRDLASALGDVRTAREIEGVLAGMASRR